MQELQGLPKNGLVEIGAVSGGGCWWSTKGGNEQSSLS